jgi:DNA-3-methyladenine glycosylase II
MIANDTTILEAEKHLTAHDKKLAPVIATYGPCTIRPHQNYYQELVESIVSQQLSIKAGAAIIKRFIALFGETFPAPEAILGKTVEELRTAGLSGAKANYIRDLAQHVVDGKVKFDHLDALSNEEVITELVAVKGIGEWTAHMFMLFCMGRMDILAYGDLGVRNGVQRLYGLKQLPSREDLEAVAKKYHWHPYESVACWYIWHSLDNMPAVEN